MKSELSLDDRMKNYERENCPLRFENNHIIIIRIDGRCFHNYTKGLIRPFDKYFLNLMDLTTEYIFKETNALAAYTQSDEMSFVLQNTETHSQHYFGGKRDKLNSILAVKASAFFNNRKFTELPLSYNKQKSEMAEFDCRSFYLPEEHEIINYLRWREHDCVKNSVSSLAMSHFSHSELDGKHRDDRLKMLKEKGISWEQLDSRYKNGRFFLRNNRDVEKRYSSWFDFEMAKWFLNGKREIQSYTRE